MTELLVLLELFINIGMAPLQSQFLEVSGQVLYLLKIPQASRRVKKCFLFICFFKLNAVIFIKVIWAHGE